MPTMLQSLIPRPRVRSVSRLVPIGLAIAMAAAPASPRSLDQTGKDTFPGVHWDVAADVQSLGWSREKLEAARAEVNAAGSAALMIHYEHEPESIHAGYWFRISARDFARFGHLYLRGGRWRDRQIVPKAWVEESTRSYSPAEPSVTKSGYGLMWWIATRSERGIPTGTYTASGTGGQRLSVIADLDTVVVNLMNTDVDGPRIGSSDWDRLLGVILQARVPRSRE